MTICNTMEQANGVLKEVKRELKLLATKKEKAAISELAICAYKNGRENGYRLKFFFADNGRVDSLDKLEFGFSESRGSDQIVVYAGPFGFDDIPTEETYKARKYFDYGDYEVAAEYIVDKVRDAVRKNF